MTDATSVDMSYFARTIVENKNYAHRVNGNGRRETWPEVAGRVVGNVVSPYLPRMSDRTEQLITKRQFMPGGRYFYAAGRKYQQLNNCLAGETRIVTRNGVRCLRDLAGQQVEVLNRFGQWEIADVKSFGVQPLWRVKFKNGDEVFATKDHRWWQADGTRVTTCNLQRVPLVDMDEKPSLDEEAIRNGIVFGDGMLTNHPGRRYSEVIFSSPQKEELAKHFEDEWKTVTVNRGAKRLFRTVRRRKAGLGVFLQPTRYKQLPDPTNCTPSYARGFIAGLIATDGSTKTTTVTISCNNRDRALVIRDLAVLGGCAVTRISKQKRGGPNSINGRVVKPTDGLYVIGIKPFSAPVIRPDQVEEIRSRKTRMVKMWLDVESVEPTDRVEEVFCCVCPKTESFTLSNGAITSNCFMFRAVDSREGWGNLLDKTTNALMTGGGIGVDYTPIRAEGETVGGLGGTCTGPVSLAKIVNEQGRYMKQGGSRRSAIWAGLLWSHKDIFSFIRAKEWDEVTLEGKRRDFNFPAALDMTNISVILDDHFFDAINDEDHADHKLARDVYWTAVGLMLRTGEPGFSIDTGENAGETLRNACTESTSSDSDDMCNLGSFNLARYDTLEQFAEDLEYGIAFLLCGTLASKLPYPTMYKVREKNRRLGLGLMGIHEWQLKRGYRYGPCDELGEWLKVYARSSAIANLWADKMSISRPVATRAIAPNGTIGIAAETTASAEPILYVAAKRRYLEGSTWKAQYVVNPTAHRLVQQGVDPDLIEDSYVLAEDVERRIKMQAWIQDYVDQGIASTINLPKWGSSTNNEGTVERFGNTLMKYLPRMRGVTVYPDGARSGQPFTRVSYQEAIKREGVIFDDGGEEACKGGVCGV